MKIQMLSAFNTYPKTQKNTEPARQYYTALKLYSGNDVSFCSSNKMYSNNYYEAVNYLNSQKIKGTIKDINDLDLDKLNGIQEGLKTFENLNIKQIFFVLRDLIAININRGCERFCAHCILDSLPPQKNNDKYASTIAFEDFTTLLNDIKELNTRLGTNIISNRNAVPLILFFDSDSIKTTLKDNNNNEYNAAQLNHMQFSVTQKPGVIDTHGWDPGKEPELQKRAEDIVKYFSSAENQQELFRLNISLNPFDKLNQEAIRAEINKDFEKALYKRLEYAYRIANIFYTFTPIAESDKVTVIQCIANENDKNTIEEIKYYGKNAQYEIDKMVIRILEKLYEDDFSTERKHIKTETDIEKYLLIWGKKIFGRMRYASRLGRMSQFYKDKNELEERAESAREIMDIIQNKKTLAPDEESEIVDYKKPIRGSLLSGLIDVNGKFYVFKDPVSIPTEIQLNYKNKNKITRNPARGLEKFFLITNEIINSLKKY